MSGYEYSTGDTSAVGGSTGDTGAASKKHKSSTEYTNVFAVDGYGTRIPYDAFRLGVMASKGITTNQNSPGMELYTASVLPEEITKQNIEDGSSKILNAWSKGRDSWFKFVLIDIGEGPMMYAVQGNDVKNKHSVCFLQCIYDKGDELVEQGLFERTYYNRFKECYNTLLQHREDRMTNIDEDEDTYKPTEEDMEKIQEGIDEPLSQASLELYAKQRFGPLQEDSNEILLFNIALQTLLEDTPMLGMSVSFAGSGSYMGVNMGKNVLCLNDKSGHYRLGKHFTDVFNNVQPILYDNFFPNASWLIQHRQTPTEAQLKRIYGTRWEEHKGTCLTDEEITRVSSKKGGTKKRRRTVKRKPRRKTRRQSYP